MAEKFPAWSSYNYTLQNPINFTDPTGMAPEGGGCGCPPDCPDDSDIPKPVQDIMDFFSWFIPSSNKKPDDTQPEEDNGTNGFGLGFTINGTQRSETMDHNKKSSDAEVHDVDHDAIPDIRDGRKIIGLVARLMYFYNQLNSDDDSSDKNLVSQSRKRYIKRAYLRRIDTGRKIINTDTIEGSYIPENDYSENSFIPFTIEPNVLKIDSTTYESIRTDDR